MKIKKIINKRLLPFAFTTILVSLFVSFFAYFIIKIEASDVDISEKDNLDFKNGMEISFSNFDKFFIIEYQNEKPYFKIDNFESLFVKKLINLDPTVDKVNLSFFADSEQKPIEIEVIYNNIDKINTFWDYTIMF